jgi:hypothetical protein
MTDIPNTSNTSNKSLQDQVNTLSTQIDSLCYYLCKKHPEDMPVLYSIMGRTLPTIN